MAAVQRTSQRRARARLLALALGLCGAPPSPASEPAQAPSARCQAAVVADRVVVRVELHGFLDEETLRLLRLGLRGRIATEASLLRKHWGPFEKTLASAAQEAELVVIDDRQTLTLNGRARLDPERPVALERLALRLGETPPPKSRLMVRASVRLQVVTLSSLSKAAAWATESTEEETGGSILTRGLLAAVVDDLTRAASCACEVTPTPPRR